jgi:hypothetical protein
MKMRHIKKRNRDRIEHKPDHELTIRCTLIHAKYDDIFLMLKLKELAIYERTPYFRSYGTWPKKTFYIDNEGSWDSALMRKTSAISPKWVFKRFLDMVHKGEV